MMKFVTRLLPALLLLTLAACGNDSNTAATAAVADTSSPQDAVMTSVALLKNNDIDGLLHASLPPAEYKAMREEWSTRADEPITDEDRAKFAEQMQRLTAPGAEEALFAQLQPMLAAFDTTYKAQLPMYIGMGQTMAATAINKSEELSPEQKQQAMDVIGAIANWGMTTNWSDPATAKQAISIVTDTARSLDLGTLDQVQALTYEQAMPKLATSMAGVKQVLAVYGFDVNAALDSVTAKTVSNEGNNAVVEYSYTLLGKPVTGSTKLVQRDGHWYNKDMLEQIEKELAKAASAQATATTEAVPAS